MATLSVWTFPEADGARLAEHTLAELAARDALTVQDAVVLTWPTGRPRPRARPLQQLACTAPVGDAFWGLLFGVAFYLPLISGPSNGHLGAGTLAGVGIGSGFIDALRDGLGEGTSALVVLADEATATRIGDAAGAGAAWCSHPLGVEAEQRLRAVFSG